jgi:hypothetical protein
MGGALLGLGGAGIIALLIYAAQRSLSNQDSAWDEGWFIAVFVVAAALALAGVYVYLAVFSPLPLPPTWSERQFQPRLDGTSVRAERIADGDLVIAVAALNSGRTNIERADLNVAVPSRRFKDATGSAAHGFQTTRESGRPHLRR